jgi:hypothetical protein
LIVRFTRQYNILASDEVLLVHAPVARGLRGGQGLGVRVTPGGLNVVAHGAAGAEATGTAGAGATLGTIDGLAVGVTTALGGEVLLAGRASQGGPTDPELHHHEEGADRAGENQAQGHGRGGNEALHDVGEHEQLEQGVQAHDHNDGGDGQVVVTEIVGPGGDGNDTAQSVHF